MADRTPAVPEGLVNALMAALDDTDCPDQDHMVCRRCAREALARVVPAVLAQRWPLEVHAAAQGITGPQDMAGLTAKEPFEPGEAEAFLAGSDGGNDERADCAAINEAQVSIDDLVVPPGAPNGPVRAEVRNDIRAALRQSGVRYANGIGDSVYAEIEWLLSEREHAVPVVGAASEALEIYTGHHKRHHPDRIHAPDCDVCRMGLPLSRAMPGRVDTPEQIQARIANLVRGDDDPPSPAGGGDTDG